jgi:hypothetical protein
VGEQPLSISIKDGPGALQLLTTTQWNALVEDCDVSVCVCVCVCLCVRARVSVSVRCTYLASCV